MHTSSNTYAERIPRRNNNRADFLSYDQDDDETTPEPCENPFTYDPRTDTFR